MGKKIAIFDFTDCEGCEVQLLSLTDIVMKLAWEHEVVNFRLGSEFTDKGQYDLSLVEGVITNSEDIKKIKKIRRISKTLVAFGSCAVLGGIQSIINQPHEREKAKQKCYNSLYKIKAVQVKPLSAYVKVDYNLRGCPANPKEIREALVYLLKGKLPPENNGSVCQECPLGPFNSSSCLVKNRKKCLGLFTYAGCGAVCLEAGLYCWGCWGLKSNVKTETIKKTLNFLPQKETENLIKSFNAYV